MEKNINIGALVNMINSANSVMHTVYFNQDIREIPGMKEAINLMKAFDEIVRATEDEDDGGESISVAVLRTTSAFTMFACKADSNLFNLVYGILTGCMQNCMPDILITEFNNIVSSTRSIEIIDTMKTVNGTSTCYTAVQRYV